MVGETLVACRAERGAIQIEALLAPPERARAGATGLSILVNGRPVRDRQLVRAVSQAYGSVLEGGRYPLGVVWLDLPPSVVDVNVHPQKAEVRFSDARGLFDAVTRELHSSLARAFGLPALGVHSQAPIARMPTTTRPIETPAREAPAEVRSLAEPSLFPPGNLFTPAAATAQATAPELFENRGSYGELRFVGQVRGTFLLCEGHDGLYVLDQHAAAERVTFDRLRKAHATRGVAMQGLLVPEVVELSPSEVAMLEENAEEVSRLGVEVRAVGDSAVAVHAVPDLLLRAEPIRLVRDLVAEVSRAAGRPFRGAVDLVLATMACHGSIRAGDAVAPAEVAALLRALDDVDFAGHCPHGRPLVMRMSFSELERRVGR
jgi:DNA mismatch repair protein MutL